MIIVSGKIYVRPETRQSYLASSAESVAQARHARGCHDFVVAADPLEADRVNVYEEWESEEALMTFRGDGPDDDSEGGILRAEVFRHQISSTGPA